MYLIEAHFFQPIISPDLLIKIPIAFIAKHLKEQDMTKLVLLRGRGGRLWPVKIEEDRSFGEGWLEFAHDHALEVGYVLNFCHKGDLLFVVDVFGRNTCRIEYPPFFPRDMIKTEEEEQQLSQPREVTAGTTSGETSAGRRSDGHCSQHPSFSMTLPRSYATGRALNIPMDFSTSNQLKKKLRARVVLVDPRGREFPELRLSCNASSKQVYLSNGWHAFSKAQGLKKGNSVTFDLIRNTESVVKFQVYHDVSSNGGSQLKKDVLNEFTVTLKPSNIRNCLAIPKYFAKKNGLARRGGKMILRGNGSSWVVLITDDSRTASIGRGWPRFVKDNKLKVGDIVRFQMVTDGSKPTMKFKVVSK